MARTTRTSEKDRREFGDRLRDARKRRLVLKPMTLQDLSNATGIAMAVLSRYHNGTQMPGVDNLVKLADALDVSTDELVFGRSELGRRHQEEAER